MKRLVAAVAVTPITILSFGHQTLAETTIGNSVTTGVRTSTARNGAADDVRITSSGSISVTSGAAATLDSNNSLTNQGSISMTNVNNVVGMAAIGGVSGTLTNSGSISILESGDPTDTDKDGDYDGPFATGSNRFGIRVTGNSPFTGNIVNTSTGRISIEGNDSAGISVETSLTGNLTSAGAISVMGNRAVGIRAKDVTGNVGITGIITAIGADASGLVLEGNVGGALTIQSSISATGYRYTTRPGDKTVRDKLDADDLLQGGPAVSVKGNVAKGILLDAPPADNNANDADEDDDGVTDSQEGTASVTSYGGAPALQIGAAGTTTTIGVVGTGTNAFGLINKGSISGYGLYDGVAATGLRIGAENGSVTINGGVRNAGVIRASSYEANASAVEIGAGATVPQFQNSGTITAASNSEAATTTRGVLIKTGGNLPSLTNSGTIHAAVSGPRADAVAIEDQSGSLGLILNSGTILTEHFSSGTTAAQGKLTAINLSANTSGATVRQYKAGNDDKPSITGSVIFGSGNDWLDLQAGTMNGDVTFGAGSDRLTINGGASFTGAINKAGSGLAVDIQNGSLTVTNRQTINLDSLNIGKDGTLIVSADPSAGTQTTFVVSGQATLADGAKVGLSLSSLLQQATTYTVIRAGDLSAGNVTNALVGKIPFFYTSTLQVNEAEGTLSLNVRRKTATELGLNRAEAAAMDAVYAALSKDAGLEDAFLGIADGDSFQRAYGQMLPDHAGGVFDAVTMGSRAAGEAATDPSHAYTLTDTTAVWLQEVFYGANQERGEAAAYNIRGFGFVGGLEKRTEDNTAYGLSLAFLTADVKDDLAETGTFVAATNFEAAAYWRGAWRGFQANGRLSAGHVSYKNEREFHGIVDGMEIARSVKAKWSGPVLSATAGVSYEAKLGPVFLRPSLTADYFWLKESAHDDKGDSAGYKLSVDSRTSRELSTQASIVTGLHFGDAETSWQRIEIEVGRRDYLSSSIGETTARFEGGQDFTLLPEDRDHALTGKVRFLFGSDTMQFVLQANGEKRDDNWLYGARFSSRWSF